MTPMHVHENPDVFRIEVPFKNHKLESTNCYAVHDSGEWLVVDTGAPSGRGRDFLLSALDDLGVDRRRAKFFLTHLHLDHAGLVDAVVPTDAPIYLNERDYRRTLPEEVERRYERLRCRLVAEGADPDSALCAIESRKQFSNIIRKPHQLAFVSENDEIRVGSRVFKVIETPGHTPGHQGLYDPASGIFFGGDHVLFLLSPSIGLFFPEEGAPKGADDSVTTYLDSLWKVRRMGISHLFHSHGELRDDFNERIDWLMEHTHERIRHVHKLVALNPGASGFEITQMIGFKVPHDRWEDISCVQRLTLMEMGAAYLRAVMALGWIIDVTDSNGIRRYYPIEGSASRPVAWAD